MCVYKSRYYNADDRKHTLSYSYVIGDLVLKKDFKRKKRAGGILDAQYVGPYITHGKGTYRQLLM